MDRISPSEGGDGRSNRPEGTLDFISAKRVTKSYVPPSAGRHFDFSWLMQNTESSLDSTKNTLASIKF